FCSKTQPFEVGGRSTSVHSMGAENRGKLAGSSRLLRSDGRSRPRDGLRFVLADMRVAVAIGPSLHLVCLEMFAVQVRYRAVLTRVGITYDPKETVGAAGGDIHPGAGYDRGAAVPWFAESPDFHAANGPLGRQELRERRRGRRARRGLRPRPRPA